MMRANIAKKTPEGCPSHEQLRAFAAGALEEERLYIIAAHLEECLTCLTLVEHLNDPADPLLAALRLPSAPDPAVRAACERVSRRVKEAATVPEEAAAAGRAADPAELAGYRVEEKLAEGGMGVVYRAVDPLRGRTVALKVLRPDRVRDPEMTARFLREVKALAGLDHPGLVRVLATPEADGVPFLVMEYVRGESLAERLRREGRLGQREAARIVGQVADALAVVHDRSLVHRDIKPSNILLEQTSGQVKLMDFGLALAPKPDLRPASESGQIVGTPAYMSPEQVAGPDRVDPRADIYSLGVVLYELLAGERPFRAAMPLTLWQVLHEDPPSLREVWPDVPPDLEAITRKCLDKEPGRRFQTGRELGDALRRWLDRDSASGGGRGLGGTLWRWLDRWLGFSRGGQ